MDVGEAIMVVATAVVVGFVVGMWLCPPRIEYVRVEVPKEVVVGPWRIGDVVRFASGGPIFHVEAIQADGKLEITRWVDKDNLDSWEGVHPGELVAAKAVDGEPKATTLGG